MRPILRSRLAQNSTKDNIRITLVPGELQEDGTIYRTPFQQGKILLLNANSKHKQRPGSSTNTPPAKREPSSWRKQEAPPRGCQC